MLFFVRFNFFEKTLYCDEDEYFFNIRVNPEDKIREWYFYVPGTVFADANLF